MKAMLLCAGFGSRLSPLTDHCPKPMLPVCNIPILHYGLRLLAHHGVRDVAINLHHSGEVIRESCGDGQPFGLNIHYFEEDVVLGTGGGLKNALDFLDDGQDSPFFSLNGKLIYDIDLSAMAAHYESLGRPLGLLAVQTAPSTQTFSALDVRPSDDGSLRLYDFFAQGTHMFCGVHITRPSVLRRLPDGESCMVRQGYHPWIQNGEAVFAYDTTGAYCAEHSIFSRYAQGSFDLLSRPPLSFCSTSLASIAPTARIHPSAQIEGPVAIGPHVVIDKGARVGPHVSLGEHSVVHENVTIQRVVSMPHSQVNADAVNAIFHDGSVISFDSNS